MHMMNVHFPEDSGTGQVSFLHKGLNFLRNSFSDSYRVRQKSKKISCKYSISFIFVFTSKYFTSLKNENMK